MIENYWTDEDCRALPATRSFEELLVVALRVAARMPQPLGMVCGPITSGGLGNIDDNIIRFDAAINYVRSAGLSVFRQLPFEDDFQRIVRSSYFRGGTHLLDVFYKSLFESGLIKILYFIPDWSSSFGARWERDQGDRLGLLILDIPIERLL